MFLYAQLMLRICTVKAFSDQMWILWWPRLMVLTFRIASEAFPTRRQVFFPTSAQLFQPLAS
jgi:hypothetical protein